MATLSPENAPDVGLKHEQQSSSASVPSDHAGGAQALIDYPPSFPHQQIGTAGPFNGESKPGGEPLYQSSGHMPMAASESLENVQNKSFGDAEAAAPRRKSPEKSPRRLCAGFNPGENLFPNPNELSHPHFDAAKMAAAHAAKSSLEEKKEDEKPRLKKSSKTLKSLGVIHRRQIIDGSTPVVSHPMVSTQFLAEQVSSAKDYGKTISVQGSILDLACRVTDGATPLEEASAAASNKSVDSDDEGDTNDYDAFVSKFPTMAPPMMFTDSAPDEGVFESFKPNIGGGTGRKKRRRTDGTGSNPDVCEDMPRSKKKRARSGKSRKDDEVGGLKRSDSNMSEKPDYPPEVRIIPDPTPRPKTHVIDGDSSPQRVCNPLLTLPQFPAGVDPAIEEIPTGGELWNYTNLVFAQPDTWPISFLGRILGFDLPETGKGVPFGEKFDAMSVPVRKEDAWLTIPERGSFSNSVWKKKRSDIPPSGQDDAHLTYTDPLWVNILQTYRGYNENDFKDAGKGYAAHLSPLVLEFAKERGVVVGDQVSFRMATLEDESILRGLDEKCKCKRQPIQDLETFLRTPGTFCIIAESANKTPIAFVQYRFCWYKVEEKKAGNTSMTSYGVKSRAGEAVDKISELVFFIDNVVYDSMQCAGDQIASGEAKENPTNQTDLEAAATSTEANATVEEEAKENLANQTDVETTPANAKAKKNPTNPTEVETARVLLMSLALIHAWSHNIWYGMMESPAPLASFYAKYFRMITVGKQGTGDESNATVVPLVCDLKKCSFRYAIHLREESLKSIQPAKLSNESQAYVKQRMLVYLSDAVDALKALQTSPGGDQPAALFANANKQMQSNQVQIRVPISQDNESSRQILSVSNTAGKETTTKLDISSLDVSASWNAFKLFSMKSDEMTTEATKTSNENDFLLAELLKKQAELQTLESSIEKTSRNLLSKAYNDCLDFEIGDRKAKKEREKKVLKDFEEVKQRLHEADLAWQAQLEQDMDAVCDVCWDGEVTPENQIIFCDSCNVAIHQGCYGIDKVPSGNYFCHPCIYYGKNNEFLAAERREGPRSAPTRTPIICELCPRRQGAYVQTQTSAESLRKPRWVHVGCAKWQGMNYIDIEKKDTIEDLTELKTVFSTLGHTCSLCKSNVGAMHECRVEGCNKWLHLTCARCVGTCSVQHGENCEGPYPADSIPFPAWSLACLEHSEVDPESVRKNSITVDQLKAIAKSYPPEPVPPKHFNKMNAKERREYWADSDNFAAFCEKVMTNCFGAFCAVCGKPGHCERCETCGIFFHRGCVGVSEQCYGCMHFSEKSGSPDFKEPKCRMCNEVHGPLLRTTAKPVSMKKWKAGSKNASGFKRSLFGPNNFCHVLCGLWNPDCRTTPGDDDTTVNTTDIVMAHGNGFINHQIPCIVCGVKHGAKVQCREKGCAGASSKKKDSWHMHVTCARAAGFEVDHSDELSFFLKCFHHSENANNLRARLEDMLEVEIGRSSNQKFDKVFLPMTWDHAASLFHSAVSILRVIGWAWRWSEWWVAEGDNWEPLIEEGQIEEEMTDEELRKVPSSPESRCKDARQCRLAAFGAAIRNREYDKEEGDDVLPLERALRAILSTPSLVGPLKKKEIDFFVLWLALAYRSKSPLLGFGNDKIPVAKDGFCVHIADGSPKYELGNRPLPGKAELEDKQVFEPAVEEVDDFLQIRDEKQK